MLGAFEYETQMSMEGTVLGEINKSEQTVRKRGERCLTREMSAVTPEEKGAAGVGWKQERA